MGFSSATCAAMAPHACFAFAACSPSLTAPVEPWGLVTSASSKLSFPQPQTAEPRPQTSCGGMLPCSMSESSPSLLDQQLLSGLLCPGPQPHPASVHGIQQNACCPAESGSLLDIQL